MSPEPTGRISRDGERSVLTHHPRVPRPDRGRLGVGDRVRTRLAPVDRHLDRRPGLGSGRVPDDRRGRDRAGRDGDPRVRPAARAAGDLARRRGAVAARPDARGARRRHDADLQPARHRPGGRRRASGRAGSTTSTGWSPPSQAAMSRGRLRPRLLPGDGRALPRPGALSGHTSRRLNHSSETTTAIDQQDARGRCPTRGGVIICVELHRSPGVRTSCSRRSSGSAVASQPRALLPTDQRPAPSNGQQVDDDLAADAVDEQQRQRRHGVPEDHRQREAAESGAHRQHRRRAGRATPTCVDVGSTGPRCPGPGRPARGSARTPTIATSATTPAAEGHGAGLGQPDTRTRRGSKSSWLVIEPDAQSAPDEGAAGDHHQADHDHGQRQPEPRGGQRRSEAEGVARVVGLRTGDERVLALVGRGASGRGSPRGRPGRRAPPAGAPASRPRGRPGPRRRRGRTWLSGRVFQAVTPARTTASRAAASTSRAIARRDRNRLSSTASRRIRTPPRHSGRRRVDG